MSETISKYIKSIYDEGATAFDENLTLEDCPYQIEGSAARWSWEAGYTEQWYSNYMENNNDKPLE